MAGLYDDLDQMSRNAMFEWMSRQQFIQVIPHSFWNDVCSEGIEDARPIFKEIAMRLKRLSEMYEEASK